MTAAFAVEIRKFEENTQTYREQTENSITQATLIPVDRWGEQANNLQFNSNSRRIIAIKTLKPGII